MRKKMPRKNRLTNASHLTHHTSDWESGDFLVRGFYV
jgi:hypothetical protein